LVQSRRCPMVTLWKHLDTLSRLTRQNARSVVLMSEDDDGGLMETVHLLKSPANAARLLRSIKDADQGKLHDPELIEADKANPAAT
jgi:antitoxin YefM